MCRDVVRTYKGQGRCFLWCVGLGLLPKAERWYVEVLSTCLACGRTLWVERLFLLSASRPKSNMWKQMMLRSQCLNPSWTIIGEKLPPVRDAQNSDFGLRPIWCRRFENICNDNGIGYQCHEMRCRLRLRHECEWDEVEICWCWRRVFEFGLPAALDFGSQDDGAGVNWDIVSNVPKCREAMRWYGKKG